MEKLEYNYKFPINPADPNNSKYRGYAWEALKRGFADKVAELVLDTSRDATICFAKFHITEVQKDMFESALRAELLMDYARELPVVIHNGFEFEGIPIKAPEELTFKERVKFILTGKYPR